MSVSSIAHRIERVLEPLDVATRIMVLDAVTNDDAALDAVARVRRALATVDDLAKGRIVEFLRAQYDTP